MKSLKVVQYNGKWILYLRDYFAQGIPPDMLRIAEISEVMAALLVQNKLVRQAGWPADLSTEAR